MVSHPYATSPIDPDNDVLEAAPNSSLDEEEDHTHNASAGAAGFVRGFTRSLGRTIARLPIGSLPRRAVFRRRLPVRQIAKLPDRVSTGLDWLSSAAESTSERSGKRSFLIRFTSFATSLVKNTILGAAVFESYGFTVLKLAPPEEAFQREVKVEDDDGNTEIITDAPDEFARASLPAHFGAGWVGGTVHGVAETIVDARGASNIIRAIPTMTVHHAIAHSLLFGSYESIKRVMLSTLVSDEEDTHYFYDSGYLASFGIAGGLAGQVQHVASHYTEQLLGITEASEVAQQSVARGSARFALAPPAFRPIMIAFPPSAIGFIAFEYGKKFMT